MIEIGYKLSSEEHSPRDLVLNAAAAESCGFGFAVLSDHFHPWTSHQGHSPFAWGVLGAIAQATDRLRVGTGVTCPTIRVHPAIVAHAAATAACLLPGRFFLGLGSGENLNEHVHGDRWPPAPVRQEMLSEAIDVIRELWEGGDTSHRREHYTVENARIYDLPDDLPPIYVAASGPKAARLAAEKGDGFIGVAPDKDLIATFQKHADGDRPRYGEVQVCWAASEAEARKTAAEWWPNSGLPGQLSQDLRTPGDFEDAAELVDADDLVESIACGPDPDRHLEAIDKFVTAGYDHVFVHQIGPDQDGFLRFYADEVLPKL